MANESTLPHVRAAYPFWLYLGTLDNLWGLLLGSASTALSPADRLLENYEVQPVKRTIRPQSTVLLLSFYLVYWLYKITELITASTLTTMELNYLAYFRHCHQLSLKESCVISQSAYIVHWLGGKCVQIQLPTIYFQKSLEHISADWLTPLWRSTPPQRSFDHTTGWQSWCTVVFVLLLAFSGITTVSLLSSHFINLKGARFDIIILQCGLNADKSKIFQMWLCNLWRNSRRWQQFHINSRSLLFITDQCRIFHSNDDSVNNNIGYCG